MMLKENLIEINTGFFGDDINTVYQIETENNLFDLVLTQVGAIDENGNEKGAICGRANLTGPKAILDSIYIYFDENHDFELYLDELNKKENYIEITTWGCENELEEIHNEIKKILEETK